MPDAVITASWPASIVVLDEVIETVGAGLTVTDAVAVWLVALAFAIETDTVSVVCSETIGAIVQVGVVEVQSDADELIPDGSTQSYVHGPGRDAVAVKMSLCPLSIASFADERSSVAVVLLKMYAARTIPDWL